MYNNNNKFVKVRALVWLLYKVTIESDVLEIIAPERSSPKKGISFLCLSAQGRARQKKKIEIVAY
jgi:hypothetical protein